MNLYGGVCNFSDVVYVPLEQAIEGELKDTTPVAKLDASYVMITYLDGKPNQPLIIGGFHNAQQTTFKVSRKDGIRQLSEFNGLRLEINNDGEYILQYLGGKRNTKTKKTLNSANAPTTFKITKDGSWSIQDKEKQRIKVDKTAKKIILEQLEGVKAVS